MKNEDVQEFPGAAYDMNDRAAQRSVAQCSGCWADNSKALEYYIVNRVR